MVVFTSSNKQNAASQEIALRLVPMPNLAASDIAYSLSLSLGVNEASFLILPKTFCVASVSALKKFEICSQMFHTP